MYIILEILRPECYKAEFLIPKFLCGTLRQRWNRQHNGYFEMAENANHSFPFWRAYFSSATAALSHTHAQFSVCPTKKVGRSRNKTIFMIVLNVPFTNCLQWLALFRDGDSFTCLFVCSFVVVFHFVCLSSPNQSHEMLFIPSTESEFHLLQRMQIRMEVDEVKYAHSSSVNP